MKFSKTFSIKFVCSLLLFFNSMETQAYNITPGSVTLSGISSGAYMAGQLQIIHSKSFSAAALIAGGLFFCSAGNLIRALNGCMKVSSLTPKISDLVSKVRFYEKSNLIDDTRNLSSHRSYFLTGQSDMVVNPKIVGLAKRLLESLGVKKKNIQWNSNLSVGHAFPTLRFGNPCETPAQTPFISQCDFDLAGNFLKLFYQDLSTGKRGVANKDHLYQIKQSISFGANPTIFSLGPTARVYVPKACQQGQACRLHVALHGCSQSLDDIGDQFVMKTGLNEWGENHRIIILYPQAVSNYVLGNPNGCWDWTGYTGPQFATKRAVQVQMIMRLIDQLKHPDFRLN